MYAKYQRLLDLPRPLLAVGGGLAVAVVWILAPLPWPAGLTLVGYLILGFNLNRLAGWLAGRGVGPDAVSLAGAAVGLAAFFPLASGWLLTGLLLAAGAGMLDVLDGHLARITDRSSLRGGVLDSVLDRIADGALLAGLIMHFAANGRLGWAGLGLAGLVGVNLVSYVRARAEVHLADCSLGFGGERPDRVIALCLTGLLGWVEIGLTYVTLTAWLTAARRMLHAWKHL